MTGLQNEIGGVSQDIRKLIRGQEHETILKWLPPTEYATQQSEYLRKREPGTSQWVLESTEFREWLETDTQPLFCHGPPGAGKSVIASLVVDHLQTKYQKHSHSSDQKEKV